MKNTLYIMPSRAYVSGSKMPPPSTEPLTIVVKGTKQKIFAKLLNFYTANGIGVRVSDANGGFLQSEPIGLGSHFTIQGLRTTDEDWAICEKKIVGKPTDSLYLYPHTIQGELQAFVLELDSGKVQVNLNLFNFYAEQSFEVDYAVRRFPFDVHSSQNLERAIAKYLESDTAKTPKFKLDDPKAIFGEPPAQKVRRQQIEMKANQAQKIERDKTSAAWVIVLLGIIVLIGLGSRQTNE